MRDSPFVHQANLAFGALFLVLTSVFALGQSSATGDTSSTASSALLLEFQQNQQELAQQMSQLISQGATPAEIFDWMNQNPIAQTQQSLALQLGAISAAQPMPLITCVNIPDDASQDLEDLLTTQASLANLRAQIHNELLQQGIVSGEQESALFQQQAAAELQEQVQRAQAVAAETDAQPLALPPPLGHSHKRHACHAGFPNPARSTRARGDSGLQPESSGGGTYTRNRSPNVATSQWGPISAIESIGSEPNARKLKSNI